MSELLFKVCGVAAVASMMILLIKKWGGDLAVMLKIASGITLAAICFGAMSPIISYVRELSALDTTGGLSESAEFLLRVLAVAVVTHFCATVCRDCGEASLGSYVELGGKTEIIILSLPLLRKIIDLAVGLLEIRV
jgi:stage III sporulation protein AD